MEDRAFEENMVGLLGRRSGSSRSRCRDRNEIYETNGEDLCTGICAVARNANKETGDTPQA